MMWLLSYRFRRCYRLPDGSVEFSKTADDRIEMLSRHPAQHIADMSIRFNRVTVGAWKPSEVETAEQVERIYSLVPILLDGVTDEQRQALEEAFAEDRTEGATCVG